MARLSFVSLPPPPPRSLSFVPILSVATSKMAAYNAKRLNFSEKAFPTGCESHCQWNLCGCQSESANLLSRALTSYRNVEVSWLREKNTNTSLRARISPFGSCRNSWWVSGDLGTRLQRLYERDWGRPRTLAPGLLRRLAFCVSVLLLGRRGFPTIQPMEPESAYSCNISPTLV